MKLAELAKIGVIGLSMTAIKVDAATLNQTFANDFDTTSIYLWSDAPGNMSFAAVGFGSNMTTWSVQSNTGAQLVLAGSTVAPGAGRFNVTMNFTTTPFTMQWAEVFFSGGFNVVRGAGTLTYQSAGWSNANTFTHLADIPQQFGAAAVPLPSSLMLLLSSLLFVPLAKLRERRAA